MPKFSMKDAQPSAQRKDRKEAEADAVHGVRESAHVRRRMGKTEHMYFRVTPEKRAQLMRLAEALSAGSPYNVSLTQTIERALDELEAKLERKGKK